MYDKVTQGEEGNYASARKQTPQEAFAEKVVTSLVNEFDEMSAADVVKMIRHGFVQRMESQIKEQENGINDANERIARRQTIIKATVSTL